MSRKTTVILLMISVVFMFIASGCSDADSPITEPRDVGYGGPFPCPEYYPGIVVVEFDPNAPLAEIETLVESFDLTIRYMSRGEVWVVARVIEDDAQEVYDRIFASPLVDSVSLSFVYMHVRFVVGVTEDDALTLVASYPEMVVLYSYEDIVYVEFEVDVGEEDEWVTRLLEEDLVIDSHRAAQPCPTAD